MYELVGYRYVDTQENKDNEQDQSKYCQPDRHEANEEVPEIRNRCIKTAVNVDQVCDTMIDQESSINHRASGSPEVCPSD